MLRRLRPDGVCTRSVALPTLIRKGWRCLLASGRFQGSNHISSSIKVRPGVENRVTIEVIDGSHETVCEFLLGCDADIAQHRFRGGDGMTAFSLTPAPLDATLEGTQSAQLRRPGPRSAMSALRRFATSP
jgi:hypothetical protein